MEINIELVRELVSALLLLFKQNKSKPKAESEDFERIILKHLNEVAHWTEKVQFFGMSQGEDIDKSTIELSLDTVPRKFKGNNAETKKLSEEELLSKDGHFILIGDPGAGKSTTIMRLARKILTSEPSQNGDRWQYPIVIRLRKLSKSDSLICFIAKELGIDYTVHKHKEKAKIIDGTRHERTVEKFLVGSCELKDFISNFMDSTNAILFLDGLDETSLQYRSNIEDEIQLLGEALVKTKIILSCRSGDYIRNIGGFNAIEICPLDQIQTRSIINKWIDDGVTFLDKLRKLPFGDLATRPLFLCQLIVLYRNTGYLPKQPSSVYRKIVRLSLEEWDHQRRVKRESSYSNFDPEQKLDFLSAIAYQLTYKIKTNRFTHAELERVYKTICKSFDLPLAETSKVALEIESHTGLVVESGSEHYEFSHLSLQEYLCAYYMVREPFTSQAYNYLSDYPPPLAVAISLSSNPSNWLSSLILEQTNLSNFEPKNFKILISRIITERPNFTSSPYLGLSILKLISSFGETIKDDLFNLLSNKEVMDSFLMSLALLDIVNSNYSYYYLLSLNNTSKAEYGNLFPDKIEVSSSIFDAILETQGMRTAWDDNQVFQICSLA